VNACTIVARNYTAHAAVLAESFLHHHPGATFTTLVLDGADGSTDGPGGSRILRPAELDLDRREFLRMAAIYNVLELSTAIKPWLLRHLLADCDHVLYFDPDIEVFAPLDDLRELAVAHGVVLTPHVTHPMPRDELVPSEQTILFAGMYNLGFVGVGASSDGFLDWWMERLARECLTAPEQARFVDQRWVDFVPALFGYHIVRDDGLNVAYWNLPSRRVTREGDGFRVSGRPLRFFHFSGFDPDRPHLLSKHQVGTPRILLSEQPAVAELCSAYARKLRSHGYGVLTALPYGFGEVDGVPIDARMRRLYRTALDEAEREGLPEPPNPFADAQSFLEWLREPDDSHGQAVQISRYLHALWRERPELQAAFRDLRWTDGERFLEWAVDESRARGVPRELAPRPPAEARVTAEPEQEPECTAPPPGVNVAGYLRAELGIGEVARQVAAAVRAAAIPHTTLTYEDTPSRQEHAFEHPRDADATYDTNIICVNADRLLSFGYDVGPKFFRNRYSIGVWFWEVADFPESMRGAFDLVNEVWVASEHVAQAVAPHTSKDVHVFPVPVEPQEPPPVRGSDRFTFLFSYDFLSIFERKNPLGALEAFTRAFAPGEGPVLILKSINGDKRLADLERLRAAAAERPDVVVQDGYLTAAEKDVLMASCDCYVSLHRSEGFGLTMAEAMMLERPVIATGYSGNLAFMSDENSYLVSYRPGEIPSGCDPYPAGGEWAEPNLDTAAELMRYVYEHPAEAQEKGRQGRRDILEHHSAERAGSFIASRLEALRARRMAAVTDPAATASGASGVQRAARFLREGPSVPIRAPSRFGRPGVFARRLIFRLLRPYMARQREFELAVVDALVQIERQARQLADDTARTARTLETVAPLARGAAEGMRVLFEERLPRMEQRVEELDQRLYPVPYTSEPALLRTTAEGGKEAIGYRDSDPAAGLYRGFEDIFRGPETFIRDRQRAYVELLRAYAPVLDLGCGRGELLELLREGGIEASGLDADGEMAAYAKAKGLAVEHRDAIAGLESRAGGSLGAITALQVLEHLPYEDLLMVLSLAHSRLAPGGMLLFETVNPHSLEAMKTFWVDLTHQRPIFPEVAAALCRLQGFASAVVVFPNGTGELERDRREQGEYAVLASKEFG
jgi:glycosyltransferase involved in cell wall biosynthesis/2-polyprenyl-3-methyl-5-hydroxy-6-metoxy-1,4-benzoquinol methylase